MTCPVCGSHEECRYHYGLYCDGQFYEGAWNADGLREYLVDCEEGFPITVYFLPACGNKWECTPDNWQEQLDRIYQFEERMKP